MYRHSLQGFIRGGGGGGGGGRRGGSFPPPPKKKEGEREEERERGEGGRERDVEPEGSNIIHWGC